MIRWTPGKVQELRDIAYLGAVRVADKMGSTRYAIDAIAKKHGISMKRSETIMTTDRMGAADERAREALRIRWLGLIGPMKDRLRAEITSDVRIEANPATAKLGI